MGKNTFTNILKLFCAGTLSLALCPCFYAEISRNEKNLAKIRKGMTEKQVIETMGEPIKGESYCTGKVSEPPVTRLAEGKFNAGKRKVMFIPDWAVLGFFDLKIIDKQLKLATVLAQECMNAETANVSFRMVPKGFQWQHIKILSNDGKINLTETFRKNRAAAAAWLAAEIEVDKDYPDARMFVGIQQYGRVFLNGKQVFVSTAKTPARSDGSNVPVQLKKGRNLILVKTACSNYRTWNVFLRFATAKKIPLMPPLKQAPVSAPSKAPVQNPPKNKV